MSALTMRRFRRIVGLRQAAVLPANNVSWFAFGGRRKPADGWPVGRYAGRYLLERDKDVVIDRAGTIDITR